MKVEEFDKLFDKYAWCIYYVTVLVLILLFPPWMISNPEHLSYGTFTGFEYIFGKHYYENIHVIFLFLEILVATLIFGAIFLYTKKK